MEKDLGRIASDRAGRASPEPASSLGHSATIPCADYIPFSTRDLVSKAIADPGLYFERFRSDDGMIEALDHWQARAALEATMRQAGDSPMFARYIAARQNRDSDTRPQDGDAKQAPLAGSAAIAQS